MTSADSKAQDRGFVDHISRREFWIVAGASLLCSITVTHSSVVALALGREHYSLEQIGILLSITAIPVLLATFLSGALTARFGARGAMQFAMVFAALGVGSLAITRDYFWAALVSRLIWGVGVGFFLPPTMVYVQSRLSQKHFVYLVSAFSATIPLGLAIAPVMGEFVLDHYGVAAMFLIGALPAVLGFLVTFALRPLEKPTGTRGFGIGSAAQGWHILPLCVLLVGGAHYGYAASYLAPALAEHGTALGFFFVPMTIATVSSRIGAMRFLAGFHPRNLAGGGLAVSGLALIVAAWEPTAALAVASGLLLGFGNSMIYPVVSAWMGRNAPAHRRSGVQAIAATAFYSGIYATPWPETYLVAAFGFSVTQMVLGLAGLVVALAIIGARTEG